MEFQSLENNYFIKYEDFFTILTDKQNKKFLTVHKDYKLLDISILKNNYFLSEEIVLTIEKKKKNDLSLGLDFKLYDLGNKIFEFRYLKKVVKSKIINDIYRNKIINNNSVYFVTFIINKGE